MSKIKRWIPEWFWQNAAFTIIWAVLATVAGGTLAYGRAMNTAWVGPALYGLVGVASVTVWWLA